MALFAYCLLLYCIGGVSASVTYHRILAHRIATLQPLLRKVLLVLALPVGPPIQWVGAHRQHHRFADKPGDPHSPLVDGFWYAHCGWYIGSKNTFVCILYALSGVFRMYFDGYWRPRTNQQYKHKALDIQQDPFCEWLNRKRVYAGIMWAYGTVLIIIAYLFWKIDGIAAVWLTVGMIYNLGDSINSCNHRSDTSKAAHHHAGNNTLLAYLTFGEGWHGNHHDQADQANLGEIHGKVDLGFQFMTLLSYLGVLKFKSQVNR